MMNERGKGKNKEIVRKYEIFEKGSKKRRILKLSIIN